MQGGVTDGTLSLKELVHGARIAVNSNDHTDRVSHWISCSGLSFSGSAARRARRRRGAGSTCASTTGLTLVGDSETTSEGSFAVGDSETDTGTGSGRASSSVGSAVS